MSQPLNPVLDGLTHAYSFAQMLHQQRIQDQQLELDQRRQADVEHEQQSREQMQNTELAMKLQAMGGRQASPSDLLEAQTGTRVQFNPVRGAAPGGDLSGALAAAGPGDAGGLGNLPQNQTRVLPSFAPSDLKSRLLKVNGQQYVLPSQDEQDARADARYTKQSKLESDAAVEKATAVERARGEEKASQLKATGITISDDAAETLGLPKGTKILPEHIDDYARAMASATAAGMRSDNDVSHAIAMYGERGSGVAVIHKDGTVGWNPIDIGGKAPAAARPETPASKRAADKAANDELVSHAANAYFQNSGGDTAKAEEALKNDAGGDAFLGKNQLAILAQIRKGAPKAKTGASTTDEILKQLNSGAPAAGDPAAAPAKKKTPAKPSKGTVNGDQIRKYAVKKAIGYAAAQKEFEDAGYTVGAK